MDSNTVRITGDRYPLAGEPLPDFLPFAEEILGVPFGPEQYEDPMDRVEVPPSRMSGSVLKALEDLLSPEQVSAEDRLRLIHSHGQLSVDEIYAILYGEGLPDGGVVDAVAYPEVRGDARDLVRFASEQNLCLIPYGGGTNVTGALSRPAEETRPVVSVDMRRMDEVIELDEVNYRARVQAGILGKDLERKLNRAGYTTGHTPDSIELSTLGGWIATKASGMKQNRYGNIEDIVLEATLVAPDGSIENTTVGPRESRGPDAGRLVFGSEGSLGLITDALLALHDTPESTEYGSLLFPDFDAGVEFLHELTHQGELPASIRLVNNTEFRLGRALKPEESVLSSFTSKLKRWYLETIKGYDLGDVAAATILLEGRQEEVDRQRRDLFRRARSHGGISGGSEAGRRGYMATFAIAYIRDFLNRMGVLGETMETSTAWDSIGAVTAAAKRCLEERCEEAGVRGTPYLSYRVTQCYRTGVCIYFTMGFCGRGLDRPVETYQRIEKQVREAILEAGGSLSHHHGIGKVRRDFLEKDREAGDQRALRRVKQTLDPDNVFGARNNVFGVGDVEP